MRHREAPKTTLARAGYSGALFGQAVRGLNSLDEYELAHNRALGQFASGTVHYIKGSTISIDACRSLARKFLAQHKVRFDRENPNDVLVNAWVNSFALTAPMRVVDRPMSGIDMDFIAKYNVFADDTDELLARTNSVGVQLFDALSQSIDDTGTICAQIESDLLERVQDISLYADMRTSQETEEHEIIAEPQALTLV